MNASTAIDNAAAAVRHSTPASAYKRAAMLLNDAVLAAREPFEVGSGFMLRGALKRTSREDVMTIATDTACAAQFWTACKVLAAAASSRPAKAAAAQTILTLDDIAWRSGQRQKRPSPVRADLK